MKYFDLHCDTATECLDHHCGLRSNGLNISLEKVRPCERWAQVFAIWIRDEVRGEAAFRRFCDACSYLRNELEKNSDSIVFCQSSADLKAAEGKKKNMALLSIEGGAAIAGSMEHLCDVYRMGVRLMTLTWNGKNEIAAGCGEPEAGGLTPFGLEVVREMNERNMIVDVSHLSETGFWDVARAARKPFVATHSDSKALWNHRRNLTDGQFREIARGGGIVGLNFCRDFLGGEKDYPELLNHAEHFLNLGGEKALALGSDFDGCELCGGITGVQDMPVLYGAAVSRFGQELADDIFYNNAFRFFTENLS